MNKVFILVVSFFVSTVYAQQKNIKFKKTSSGLEYAILKKGKGGTVKNDYRVYLNYITRIIPDSVFDSNVEKKKPYAFVLGQDEVLKGWEEGISLLSVGDSAHFRIPPALAFGEKKTGRIPANTTLLLEVKVLKTEEAFYNHFGRDTISYPSGLKKIMISPGTHEMAKAFNNVTMQFTGYVFNKNGYKRVFQSSLTNSNVAVFQLGTGKMVKGLDEGIATMKVGEKATFIVPPGLGFGKDKSGIVPGNSTLYFDIELLSSVDPFFHPVNTDTIHARNGLKILPILKNEGEKITTEDVVSLDYTGYFLDSLGHPVIFYSTLETKKKAVVRPSTSGILPAFGEGLTYLKKGDKAILFLPSNLGYGEKITGIIPKNKALVFDVHIVDAQTYPFFDIQSLDTVKNSSGLHYIQVKKGTGPAVTEGSRVSVSYTGFIIDSLGYRRIFDASRESGVVQDFVIGNGKVIKGFEEGIKGMSLGEARRLIIPFGLGYGENGMPEAGIPAKATLYFDVELVGAK